MQSQNTFPRRQRPQQANKFADLCDKLLSQKERLTERQHQTFQIPETNAQINSDPQYITGVVQSFRKATEEEKKSYGLEDSSTCYKFFLKNYLVVIATRLPNQYPDKTPVSLYLPTQMTLSPQPQIQDRKLVVISPFMGQRNSNFMDYPYIIVQAQKNLSPSNICSMIQCKRYISLKKYLESLFEINENLVFGQAGHKFLQHLIDNLEIIDSGKTIVQFKNVIRSIYNGMLYDFYIVYHLEKKQADFDYFYNKCEKSFKNIYFWVDKYLIKNTPIYDANYPNVKLVINKVICSESTHVSKYFGLKGKIDGLFKGTRFDVRNNFKQQVYIPFQLKTGWKIKDEHKRQADIYTMLIRQKYNLSTIGLLFYQKKQQIVLRPQNPQNAFSNLMMQRNVILLNLKKLYLNQKISLPDFTFNNNPCKHCDKCTKCQILYINDQLQSQGLNYYKKKYLTPKQKKKLICKTSQEKMLDMMNEDQNFNKQQTPSDINQKTRDKIEDLTYPEIQYIRKWMSCLYLQEKQKRTGQEIKRKEKFYNFNINSEEIEKLMKYHCLDGKNQQKLNLTIYKGFFSSEQFKEIIGFYQMGHKMRLSISNLGIAQCKILSSRKLQKVIELRIELSYKNLSLNRVQLQSAVRDKVVCDVLINKLDKHSFSVMRNNVFGFVLGSNQKLKRIVIEDYQPRITQQKKKENQQGQDFQKNEYQQSMFREKPIEISPSDCGHFNIYQQRAFRQVFSRQYCTVVQGMSGTGKKQLIVRLLNKCNQLNWRVLITSMTNRLLDNILEKTLKSGVISQTKIIHEGKQESIDPRFQKFPSSSKKFESIHDYSNYFNEKNFWFVTQRSVNRLHIPKEFDLVILCEASHSFEPACIQALNRGAKVVLIGDYKQLQPIVKSTKASSQGMSISLFQRLCNLPDLAVTLRYQYRMNKQIMKLSNSLVYQGQLILGDQQTANKVVKLNPNWFILSQKLGIIDIINPQKPVVFLNHDWFFKQVNGEYKRKREEIVHMLEVMTAVFLFLKLLEFGVKLEDITIVCVYNNTVEVIKKYFQRFSTTQQLSQTNEKEEGQVLTIDKSQGIDKEVIILLAESRQNTNNLLLEDCRRMNVALTRAKTKLIIIGSMEYLEENPVLREKLPPMLRGKEVSIEQDLVENVIRQLNLKENLQNNQNVQRENNQQHQQNEQIENVQRQQRRMD